MKLCGARNGWYCTLPADPPHEIHIATIGLKGPEVFRWKDGDPKPVMAPAGDTEDKGAK